MPVLRIGRRRFIGPGDGLMDISVEELIAADAELTLYTATKDPCHIDNMLATLYRRPGPRQPAGRHVEPLDIDHTERAARVFRFVPAWKNICFCFGIRHASTTSSTEPLQSTAAKFHLPRCSTTMNLPESRSAGLERYSTWQNAELFGDLKETSATGIIDILLLLLNDKYNADNARKNNTAD